GAGFAREEGCCDEAGMGHPPPRRPTSTFSRSGPPPVRTATRLLGLAICLTAAPALAHPGAGIVVDRQGQVFFIDTGAGVWKIDRQGQLKKHPGDAFHWMAIDRRGGLTQ